MSLVLQTHKVKPNKLRPVLFHFCACRSHVLADVRIGSAPVFAVRSATNLHVTNLVGKLSSAVTLASACVASLARNVAEFVTPKKSRRYSSGQKTNQMPDLLSFKTVNTLLRCQAWTSGWPPKQATRINLQMWNWKNARNVRRQSGAVIAMQTQSNRSWMTLRLSKTGYVRKKEKWRQQLSPWKRRLVKLLAIILRFVMQLATTWLKNASSRSSLPTGEVSVTTLDPSYDLNQARPIRRWGNGLGKEKLQLNSPRSRTK